MFTSETLIEIYGYLGSLLVVVSMLMSSVVKLRIINTVGSVISGSYALIIGSIPLALMNICLIIINVYNLMKLLSTKQKHDLLRCSGEDAFVGYFLKQYEKDIKIYFPEFRGVEDPGDAVYMILCNAEPAGILVGKTAQDGAMESYLEYATPTYRDCSIGKFLYGALPGVGVNCVRVPAVSKIHEPYLKKMGYTFTNGIYTKEL